MLLSTRDVQCRGCSFLQLLLLFLGDAEIQKLFGHMDVVPPILVLVLSFLKRKLSSSSHGPCWSLDVLVINFLQFSLSDFDFRFKLGG